MTTLLHFCFAITTNMDYITVLMGGSKMNMLYQIYMLVFCHYSSEYNYCFESADM